MSDYGMKISSPGEDVLSTEDFSLLTSDLPLLKIEHAEQVTINTGSNQTLYTHNLGFHPLFFVFTLSGGYAEYSPNAAVAGGFVTCNATELRFNTSSSTTTTFYYVVFRQPITSTDSDEVVPTEPPSSEKPIVDNYGIKVSKEGFDATSPTTTLQDYIINSNAQSVTANVQFTSLYQGYSIVGLGFDLGFLPHWYVFYSAGGSTELQDSDYFRPARVASTLTTPSNQYRAMAQVTVSSATSEWLVIPSGSGNVHTAHFYLEATLGRNTVEVTV